MAYPPPAGYQPVRGVRDRTEQDVMDTQDRVREEVRRDYDQQPGQHFYIDNEVVMNCWSEIWRWLNVSSLSSHLLKYGIVSDPSELYLLTSPYQTPRQRADHLLTLVYKGGVYGCHLLYMCIRDDDENLGHASAVEKLMAVARSKGKRAPHELFGVYQQHLVYRDGVGDRVRAEPDDEPGPQSVEADGARHRRRDDGGEGSGDGGPLIQESGQSATTARVNTEGRAIGNGVPAGQMSLHAAEEETNRWPQQRLIAGQSESRERIRRQSGGAARRQSDGEGGQRTARPCDEGQRTGSVSSSASDNSLLSSPMSPSSTISESTSERRVPSNIPLLPPSSFTTPNSTPLSATPNSSVCPSLCFPSAGGATSSGSIPMRRVVSFPPLSHSQGSLGCEEITNSRAVPPTRPVAVDGDEATDESIARISGGNNAVIAAGENSIAVGKGSIVNYSVNHHNYPPGQSQGASAAAPPITTPSQPLGGSAANTTPSQPLGGSAAGGEATDESIETPLFKLTPDIKDKHQPLSPPGEEPKKRAVKKFAKKVQLVIQTCNPPEYYAALEKLKPPRIQEFNKSVEYPCSELTIVVGTFANIDAAVIRTRQGAKCRKELEAVFKNVFTNAKLLLGLGVCYGLKKNFAKHDLKFADVLVGEKIDAVLTPKFKPDGTMDTRGEDKVAPKSVQKLFCEDPDMWRNFSVCEEPSKRNARAFVGCLASMSILINNPHVVQGLEKSSEQYLGGEMEGWAQIEYVPEGVKCIIIKGIADFASGSKDKVWQLTAAMAAVDYAHYKLSKRGIHFDDSVMKSDRTIDVWKIITIIVLVVSVILAIGYYK